MSECSKIIPYSKEEIFCYYCHFLIEYKCAIYERDLNYDRMFMSHCEGMALEYYGEDFFLHLQSVKESLLR